MNLAINLNLGHPSLAPAILVDAQHSAVLVVGGRRPSVLVVERASSFSEILQTVVSFLTVDMVDIVFRPLIVDKEPEKPMFKVANAVYDDASIAGAGDRAGAASGLCAVFVNLPIKLSRFLIPRKQRVDFVGCMQTVHERDFIICVS